MHIPAEDGIHYPVLQIVPLDATDAAVVLHAQQDRSTFQVGHGHGMLSQPIRIGAFRRELDPGVLSVREAFKEVCACHRSPTLTHDLLVKERRLQQQLIPSCQ